MMGFLALPTWIGPVGLVDVCSTLTLMPVGSARKSPSVARMSSMTPLTRAAPSMQKLRYPLQDETDEMSPDGCIAAARSSAIACGAFLSALDIVKHGTARAAVSTEGSSVTNCTSAPIDFRASATLSRT